MEDAAQVIERLDIRAHRVRGCLQPDRGNGADQHRLANTARAVPTYVSNHFPAAGRMPDMNRILQVQRLGQFGEVVCECVKVIALPRLAGSTMPTPVCSDNPVSVRCEEEHLVFKRVRRQRPAMTEDNRAACAPILEVNPRSVRRRQHIANDTFARGGSVGLGQTSNGQA